MDVADIACTAKAWRNRFNGLIAYDLSAAEAAIRRVYRVGAVREPEQILWVKGPNDAVQAIRYLMSPPRTMRRIAAAMVVFGAAAWLGLALAIDSGGLAATAPVAVVALSVIYASVALVVGGGHRLPVPPDLPPCQLDRTIVLLGATIFIALAADAFVLQHLGSLPNDQVGRGTALSLAAAFGTLPGLFFRYRVERASARLPSFLRELQPSRSVARRLERARREAWASFRPTAVGSRPNRSLVEAYHRAYWQALAREHTHLLDTYRFEAAGGTAPYLDGIEDAARAMAVANAGAHGSAASFVDLAFRVDRLYPFAMIAVAVRPATRVALDAEGRPHSAEGPALVWADGTRVYSWHGRPVPAELVDPELPVTRSRIDREADPGRRSVLVEQYGLGRYLLEAGAAEIQHDDCGRLYRLTQHFREPILAVRVVNHTPEPDGTSREFWLRVPPTMTSARQVVAWTFNLSVAAYDPVAQS